MKNRAKLMLIVPAVALLLPFGEAGAQADRPWKRLKTTYEAYLKEPSTKNVDGVCAAITNCENAPAETPISAYVLSPGARAQADVDDFIMAHLDVPEKKVKEGDRASIHLIFRLLSVSDAAFSEDLNEILDLPIHRNPELFLEEMLDNRKWLDRAGGLQEILTFLGTAFADQEGQPRKEYRRRIRDLQKVTQPDLKGIRDECVRILENEIRQNDQGNH